MSTIFTEGHQYRRTDSLVGTGLMPYKAHSPKYQYFMLFPVVHMFVCTVKFLVCYKETSEGRVADTKVPTEQSLESKVNLNSPVDFACTR